MSQTPFLMPRSLRFVGIFFLFSGIILGMIRFYSGIKPEILEIKVFAFYSLYLQTNFMKVISNNMIEELAGFFLITGLFLSAFTREKIESPRLDSLRLKSFYIAAYLNFLFLFTAFFFTYGLAFIHMLMVNMGFGLLSYIVSLRVLIFLNRLKSGNL